MSIQPIVSFNISYYNYPIIWIARICRRSYYRVFNDDTASKSVYGGSLRRSDVDTSMVSMC